MIRRIAIRIFRIDEIRKHLPPELRSRTLSRLQWVRFAEVHGPRYVSVSAKNLCEDHSEYGYGIFNEDAASRQQKIVSLSSVSLLQFISLVFPAPAKF